MPNVNDRDANRAMNERRRRLANLPRRQPTPAQIADVRRRATERQAQSQFKSAAAAALKADADRRFGHKGKMPSNGFDF